MIILLGLWWCDVSIDSREIVSGTRKWLLSRSSVKATFLFAYFVSEKVFCLLRSFIHQPAEWKFVSFLFPFSRPFYCSLAFAWLLQMARKRRKKVESVSVNHRKGKFFAGKMRILKNEEIFIFLPEKKRKYLSFICHMQKREKKAASLETHRHNNAHL